MLKTSLTSLLALALATAPAWADGTHIEANETPSAPPAFDIRDVAATVEKGHLHVEMTLAGEAGSLIPEAVGSTAGAKVNAYVWPLGLDSSAAGFAAGQGTLALVATSHPDFDDSPLFDENGDGDSGNDGALWHSHWVVLVPDQACGDGALKVADIPAGTAPKLPKTWSGLPLLLDSPGYSPSLAGQKIALPAALDDPAAAKDAAFDGVTAELRVSSELNQPLLCVTQVHDVASGDLSLPGRIGSD